MAILPTSAGPLTRFSRNSLLKAMLAKLSFTSLKFSVVSGAAAATNIPITGIVQEDSILAVLNFKIETATVKDVTNVTDVTVTSAGNVQSAATVTTGNKLLVIWVDKSA